MLSGLRVDESERIGSISKPEDDSSSGNGVVEVGSDANWPPWKNVPERYKLIGTTALAFVICNMDKVGPLLLLTFNLIEQNVVGFQFFAAIFCLLVKLGSGEGVCGIYLACYCVTG